MVWPAKRIPVVYCRGCSGPTNVGSPIFSKGAERDQFHTAFLESPLSLSTVYLVDLCSVSQGSNRRMLNYKGFYGRDYFF
jgi:hypothetical protein